MNLCFFSLNSLKEFAAAKKVLKNMNSIHVKEWLEIGSYPKQSFLRLLQSDKKCDGLVISGHHRTQGFDGQRSHSFLSVEQLERWSCNPEWSAWFKHVKVLWLQGCATSRRQDNNGMSLAHRYAKVFPNASMFAWSGSAPLKASYLTIPYHFVNLKKMLHEKDMEKILVKLLQGKYTGKSLLAWKKLRNKSNRKYLGIWNHTAQAFYPHFHMKENIKIHESTCSLLNPSLEHKRLSDIEQILSSEKNLMTNIDLILKELKSLNENPYLYPQYMQGLKNTLANSKLYKKILAENIYNKKYSSLKKIKLYKLHLYAGSKPKGVWEENIKLELIHALNTPIQHYDRVELKQYNDRILLSLMEKLPNGTYLFKSEEAQKITHPQALAAVLRMITRLSHPKKIDILYALSGNHHMEGGHLHKLTWLLRVNNIWRKNKIFHKILSNPNTKPKTIELIKEQL